MSRDLSIPGTNISIVTDRAWSFRIFSQLLNGNINQSAYRDGIWNLDQLIARPVPLSPLASVTYNSGKEVSRSPHFRYAV